MCFPVTPFLTPSSRSLVLSLSSPSALNPCIYNKCDRNVRFDTSLSNSFVLKMSLSKQSFPFLSFPFLSYPLLSFPCLSFTILSFPFFSFSFLFFSFLSYSILSFPSLTFIHVYQIPTASSVFHVSYCTITYSLSEIFRSLLSASPRDFLI